jgi:hypothetical protein
MLAELAHYRMARYQSALDQVRHAREVGTRYTGARAAISRATISLIEAMAFASLHRTVQAREALKMAEQTFRGGIALEGPKDWRSTVAWEDRASYEILHREAQTLLLDKAFPADPFAR